LDYRHQNRLVSQYVLTEGRPTRASSASVSPSSSPFYMPSEVDMATTLLDGDPGLTCKRIFICLFDRLMCLHPLAFFQTFHVQKKHSNNLRLVMKSNRRKNSDKLDLFKASLYSNDSFNYNRLRKVFGWACKAKPYFAS